MTSPMRIWFMLILPDSKEPGKVYKINLMICSLTTHVERMKFAAQRYECGSQIHLRPTPTIAQWSTLVVEGHF